MEFPEHLKYTKDHEWVEVSGKEAKVGVSAYAIEHLGDIVHIELPEVGESFGEGDSFGTIESTKTVSDLFLPVAGRVTGVNVEATDNPESLQEDPYKAGWLIKVEMEDGVDFSNLFDQEGYEKFISELDD